MEDIDKVLSYQIKKEIADRYFSFRKLIEHDSRAYLDSILDASTQYEAGIGLNLIRLYILLKDPTLINTFQHTISVAEKLFYDPYICSSPTIRDRLFSGFCSSGLTRKTRFRNLFFDIYQRLFDLAGQYRTTYTELVEEHETISEEIELFYRKNDLQLIMSFIRSLDHQADSSTLLNSQHPSPDTVPSLEDKMRLSSPQAAQLLLPPVPSFPPLGEIKGRLRKIVDLAIAGQPDLDVRNYCTARPSAA